MICPLRERSWDTTELRRLDVVFRRRVGAGDDVQEVMLKALSDELHWFRAADILGWSWCSPTRSCVGIASGSGAVAQLEHVRAARARGRVPAPGGRHGHHGVITS